MTPDAAGSERSALATGTDGEAPPRTSGPIALAGLASMSVTYGLALRSGVGVDAGVTTVLPVGAVVTWIAAAALYRRDFRRLFAGP